MISRRVFIAAPLVVTALSCKRPPATASPAWNTARGFASVDGQRLDVLDGHVTLRYQPWEWKTYSFSVHLWHAVLTEAQRATVRAGKWCNPNFRNPLPSFPDPTPEVTIGIGSWKYGQRPVISDEMAPSIDFARFRNSVGTNFRAPAEIVRLSKVSVRYSLEVVTKGEHTTYDGKHFVWDLVFSGTCYEDTWMMEPDAAKQDWS